jgi:hypothetical protein
MYNYEEELPKILTENGQKDLMKAHRHISNLLSRSGVVNMDRAMGFDTGDTWYRMAIVDHLMFSGVLEEVRQANEHKVAAQDRIFRLVRR